MPDGVRTQLSAYVQLHVSFLQRWEEVDSFQLSAAAEQISNWDPSASLLHLLA